MSTVHNCEFEPINHPPYSPDLAPSNYFLFLNMKNIWLETGTRLIMTSFAL